jgi:RsiW-degrading membrane proteinase PrsW (M82 family)
MFDIFQVITIALLGGIIPCLLWLVFWLRENTENPEPRRVVFACFIAGMITTLLVIPAQYVVILFTTQNTLISLTLWAFIEEIAKFGACYFVALRTRFERIPIDAVIYMVAVALGFSAFENAIYLVSPLMEGDAYQTLMTGNFRFIGATLLHTVSSAIIGIAIAFSFYKSPHLKHEYALVGIILAGVLHTLFNFFILQGSNTGNAMGTFFVFVAIWLLVMALIVILERVKTIKQKNI